MEGMKRVAPARAGILLLLTLYALLVLFPLIWMFYAGFKSNTELFTDPWALPGTWRLENFRLAWKAGIGRYFSNSLLVTVASTALTILVAILGAYPLARFRFDGQRFWLLIIVGGLMIAPQVAIIPLFKTLKAIGLYNTYWAMILPYLAYRLPFTLFLFWSHFISIPKELEEAAIIDGCGSLGVLHTVIIPLSKPITATAILLVVRYVWNELLFALIFIEDTLKKTIPVGLAGMKSQADTDWTVLLAGCTLATLPVIIIFFSMQKHLVRGLTAGSVKG